MEKYRILDQNIGKNRSPENIGKKNRKNRSTGQPASYKSMETLRCHSNQSSGKNKISYPTEIKNTNYVETTVRNMYTKYRLHAVDNF